MTPDTSLRPGANRRKLGRLSTDMRVEIEQERLWGGWRLAETGARGLDYNRFGMGFLTRRRYRPDSRLKLSLHGPAMILRRVPVRVVSCTRSGNGYRIGVRFQDSLREVMSGQPPESLRYLQGLEEQLG